MSTSINSSISGKFIVEDIHGNVLAEEHNEISDWGMVRLTNYEKRSSAKYMRCLADNLKRIFPGTGSIGTVSTTATGATPSAYVANHRLQTRILPANYDHFNEPSVTKTTYSRAANGNLIITFSKGSRLEFKSGPFQIQELGIGFNYDSDPNHTYATIGSSNKYIPNPQPICHSPSTGIDPNTGTTVVAPPYTEHQDNIDFSLWSRAVISPSIDVENGDILIVKYVLTIETDCDRTKSDWNFQADPNTGAVALNPRKTSVRRKPFYSLLPGTGKVTGAAGAITSYGNCPTEFGGIYGQEPSGNVTQNPNGYLGILPTLEQPFLGRNEMYVFEGFDNTLYANFPTHNTSTNSTFPSPSALSATHTGVYVSSLYNKNHSTTKLRHSYRTSKTSDNKTFVCQHRFLFNPGEWPTLAPTLGTPLGDARNFSFIRWNADYTTFTSTQISNIYTGLVVNEGTPQNIGTALNTANEPIKLQPLNSDRTNTGVFTALSAFTTDDPVFGGKGYNPYKNDAAMYVGFDYTFTFTKTP